MENKSIPEFEHVQCVGLFNNICFGNSTVFEHEISSDGEEIRFTKQAPLIDYRQIVDTNKKDVTQSIGYSITLKTDKEIPFEWMDKNGNVRTGSTIYPAGIHHFKVNLCNCFHWDKFSEMSEAKELRRPYEGESIQLSFMKECFDRPITYEDELSVSFKK